MNNFIIELDFKNTKKNYVKYVGGKAHALIILKKNKIILPKGFVLNYKSYELFLKENNIISDIKKLASVKNKDIQQTLSDIRKKILNGRIPKEILDEIKYYIDRYSINNYAVRSSANIEDGSKKSWAGQFESYLNVSPKYIDKNIKKCWASIFSNKVINYTKSINDISAIKMAVILQESIESDVSGVCFTRNPLSNNDDNILIEAVFGLGELLVQGNILPDRYEVERKNDIILDANVNEQNIAFKTLKKGGIKMMPIKKTFKQKLSGREIINLAKIAKKIEKIYKRGCDIEWCKKEDKIYILQSRPITTGNKK